MVTEIARHTTRVPFRARGRLTLVKSADLDSSSTEAKRTSAPRTMPLPSARPSIIDHTHRRLSAPLPIHNDSEVAAAARNRMRRSFGPGGRSALINSGHSSMGARPRESPQRPQRAYKENVGRDQNTSMFRPVPKFLRGGKKKKTSDTIPSESVPGSAFDGYNRFG